MDLARFPVDEASFDGPVLVTGAGGCIGSWALALLTNAGVPAIAFDLSDDRRRPRLLITEDELAEVPWITGDIAGTDTVADAVAQHDVRAIIHLAALQVPFCKADPVAGAKANVVGTVNAFEAARQHGLQRVAYASSIAAHSFFPGAPWLATLYGAYKLCDEMIARTYAEDWDVPSIGIRPGVVYGVGRDQGLTSKTTVAILAAAAERPYTVPFSGEVSALHAGEVASAFIKAVSEEREGAQVFDLNGRPTTVAEWLDIVRALAPGAQLNIEGDPLPFRPICRTSRSVSISATTAPCHSRTASKRPTMRSGGCSPPALSRPRPWPEPGYRRYGAGQRRGTRPPWNQVTKLTMSNTGSPSRSRSAAA